MTTAEVRNPDWIDAEVSQTWDPIFSVPGTIVGTFTCPTNVEPFGAPNSEPLSAPNRIPLEYHNRSSVEYHNRSSGIPSESNRIQSEYRLHLLHRHDLDALVQVRFGEDRRDYAFYPASLSSHPEVRDRIEYLCGLEPNWDGYGAEVISDSALNTCRQLLGAVSSTQEKPFIAPMADGGIQLDWEFDSGTELMVVIPNRGRPVRYLRSSSDGDEQSGQLSHDSQIQDLLTGEAAGANRIPSHAVR